MENLIRNNINNLLAYSSARDEYSGSSGVFLDANENPFENGINRYPDPFQWKLKAKISALKNISKEKVLLGNGSDEILDLSLRIFCEPGVDNVIICPPTYGMYKVLAETNNVKIKKVELKNDFSPDIIKIANTADENTKLLILCSPNNPTGNSIGLIELEQLLQVLNCVVLVDEAYIDFSNHESAVTLLEKYPNLIVSQTLSKAWGMAGLRIGMAFASVEIIEVFNKVKPPYNVNVLSQNKAIEELGKQDLYLKNLNSILIQKKRLLQDLNSLAIVEKVYPSDTNFLLVKFSDSTYVFNEFRKSKIIVRDRSKEILCENCLRISIGTSDENYRLITKLKEIDYEKTSNN